ncbi:hypothetical protein QE152_g1906 [Popillia japonica]|uniref:Protein YIPF n=1 Tax=Popillia japonica TaxID=7064 RepID=A0AAW1N0L0_POPJA
MVGSLKRKDTLFRYWPHAPNMLDVYVSNRKNNGFEPWRRQSKYYYGSTPDQCLSLTDQGKIMVSNPGVDKTLTVLNPFHTPEVAAVQGIDLAGPLVFCLAFGAFLLLSGKVHFSYIYGIGVLGCLSMWALLSLMSTTEVSLGTVVTVLGYCILPMVGLSGINVILSLQGYVGIVLTSLAIMWCSLSASKLFVTALSMDHQQPLVVYPCALLYGVFALITIF